VPYERQKTPRSKTPPPGQQEGQARKNPTTMPARRPGAKKPHHQASKKARREKNIMTDFYFIFNSSLKSTWTGGVDTHFHIR